MSNASKIKPLDKTVLTEFKIQVADIHIRSKHMVESIAAKIPRDTSFVSGDYVITDTSPLSIQGVKAVIAIHSYVPIVLTIGGTDIPCSGLFILYGALESISVRAPDAGASTRLTYLYA